ncbi:hypothetical protein Nepgr_001834 [Nepenthes gracilis]|uniref:Protein SPT2 homolog n=1 Tax=Nepenthes gracilis TaxID=150966 RepID=A0AAD3P6V0_NEPGR|nr:hypothetical protein Nepgr_001834 [Nepenthes gracilis]
MRCYNRVDEDLNDYGEDEEDQYEDIEAEEYDEAEEEVAEEDPTPKKEVLEYLELRQKLKEAARKKLRKESGSARNNFKDQKKISPLENFGSFFGPSQPIIADRVIQERRSLSETRHLAPQVSGSQNDRKRSITSRFSKPNNGVSDNHLRNQVQHRNKVQKLKDTRDYSFLLSDNAEVPGQVKDTPAQNNSDARSFQVPTKSKVFSPHLGRLEERTKITSMPAIRSTHTHPVQKLTSGGRPNPTTLDSKRELNIKNQLEPTKQLGISNRSGPGRPSVSRDSHSKKPSPSMEKKAPVAVEKKGVASLEKRTNAVGVKHSVPGGQRPPLVKSETSGVGQHLEQKRKFQEYSEQRALPKKAVSSSKAQMNNRQKQLPSRTSLEEERFKKKQKPVRRFSDDENDDEDEKALSMIRKMFRYNPGKYRDDDDVSDMEADFSTIMKEERRSARIAREEDERELRLIEEQERRERMRKEAKKPFTLQQRCGNGQSSRAAASCWGFLLPPPTQLQVFPQVFCIGKRIDSSFPRNSAGTEQSRAGIPIRDIDCSLKRLTTTLQFHPIRAFETLPYPSPLNRVV